MRCCDGNQQHWTGDGEKRIEAIVSMDCSEARCPIPTEPDNRSQSRSVQMITTAEVAKK